MNNINSDDIKVLVRMRPLSIQETQNGSRICWHINSKENSIEYIRNTSKQFTFDRIYDCEERTHLIFDEHVRNAVRASVSGYNLTVFAYGQTSSGKTHTMMGSGGEDGLIQRSLREIFQCFARAPERNFMMRVSYLEIYNESIRDLLNPESKSDLKIYQDSATGPTVKGLMHFDITNIDQV